MERLRGVLVGALLLSAPAVADAATASSIVSVSASVAVTCVLAIKAPIDPRLAEIALYRLTAMVDGTVRSVSVGCSRKMPRISITLERAGAHNVCSDNRIPAELDGRSNQVYLAVLNF